ncbi:MAG: hypothetical protein JWQ24_1711 [Tardiphaga sp.]|nr:hypothetical protein [Tardiphaga sp.]
MSDTAQIGERSGWIAGLDGRTAAARRVRQVIDLFTAALGGTLDPMKHDAVLRAAELQVTAEALRTRSLRGEPVAPGDLIKAENLADRARRSLRIGDAPARTIRPIRERLRAAG